MINKIAAIKMANTLIQGTDIKDYHFSQVKKMMSELDKKAGLGDFLRNPFISTIMSLLTPYIGNYRVREALKLLMEALKESL